MKTGNHIMRIEKAIRPELKEALTHAGDTLHNTAVQNVQLSINNIKADKKLLPHSLHMNDLNIYGAVYDLSNGKISPIQ